MQATSKIRIRHQLRSLIRLGIIVIDKRRRRRRKKIGKNRKKRIKKRGRNREKGRNIIGRRNRMWSLILIVNIDLFYEFALQNILIFDNQYYIIW